jgi:hypothetical protein
MNAAALRSDRVRRWVAAHNAEFFEFLGSDLAEALGLEVDDAGLLGLVAQSLYAGLTMHGAFDGGVDEARFAEAYRLLAQLARE